MPPPERRALLLLLALAVAGQGVRLLATRPGEPPGQVQLISSVSNGSPAAQRDSTMRESRPLAAGETVDPDVVAAAELARLPRVGLALAKVIVSDRQARGPFGSLEGLDRVPGIGPGLLRTLAPFSPSAARQQGIPSRVQGLALRLLPQPREASWPRGRHVGIESSTSIVPPRSSWRGCPGSGPLSPAGSWRIARPGALCDGRVPGPCPRDRTRFGGPPRQVGNSTVRGAPHVIGPRLPMISLNPFPGYLGTHGDRGCRRRSAGEILLREGLVTREQLGTPWRSRRTPSTGWGTSWSSWGWSRSWRSPRSLPGSIACRRSTSPGSRWIPRSSGWFPPRWPPRAWSCRSSAKAAP